MLTSCCFCRWKIRTLRCVATKKSGFDGWKQACWIEIPLPVFIRPNGFTVDFCCSEWMRHWLLFAEQFTDTTDK